jgi:hypothetical protein
MRVSNEDHYGANYLSTEDVPDGGKEKNIDRPPDKKVTRKVGWMA